jgi:predicted dehydrogenase
MSTSNPNELSRRGFIGMVGGAALAGSLAQAKEAGEVKLLEKAGEAKPADKTANVPDNPLASDRKIKVGIVGGGFGLYFQFHEHPNCIVQAVSDLRADRRSALMKAYKCERSYESLEELLKDKDIEAVAIFTEAPNHAKHVLEALAAGKHVACAVPAAMTLEDCEKILEARYRTGLTYMMLETSYYRYYTIAARELFNQGKFGELFYSEVEYYHPFGEGFKKQYFYYEGKPTWRYGIPPMLYPTHSNAFLIAVTKERFKEVACLGWGDTSEDYLKDNAYNNRFNAMSALLKTDKGHMCRSNVFWAGTEGGERAQWFGTKMSMYMPGSGGQTFRLRGEGAPEWADVPNYWERLPRPLRHDSGHGGSHTFLTHEFIAALIEKREPTVNVHEALAMTAPGIVANESAKKGGEQMKVPDFDKKA